MGASSAKPSPRIVEGRIDETRYGGSISRARNAATRSSTGASDGCIDIFSAYRAGSSTSSTAGPTYSYSSARSTTTSLPPPPPANIQTGYSSFNAPSSSTVTTRQSTAIDQLEEADIARAIRLSLTANQTSRVSNLTSSTLSWSHGISQYPKSNTANVNRVKALANTSVSNSASAPKGEMAFDCSICMEFNEKDVIVATECGHVFHKECVSPWIQQAGTCPTCRLRITIASLRKIFISVNSSGNALKSNTTNSRNNNNNTSNGNGNNRNNNAGIQRRNNPNRSTTSSTMFRRTIWLSSQDKQITEQSLAVLILHRFNISLQKISIKSLKKAGTTQPPQRYVSFKISVDSESTFNTLVDVTKWPRTFRVREFIERN